MPVINKYHHGNKVPDGAVDIMRGTEWGNPFIVGVHGDRAEVVQMYKVDLWKRIRSQEPGLLHNLAQLRGRTLCCCCKPAACHGDILEKASIWAYEYLNEKLLKVDGS